MGSLKQLAILAEERLTSDPGRAAELLASAYITLSGIYDSLGKGTFCPDDADFIKALSTEIGDWIDDDSDLIHGMSPAMDMPD